MTLQGIVPKLEGRVILVTGAAQGQGLAIARAFVNDGAHVVLCDIQDGLGMRAADEFGPNAIYAPLNVAHEDEWEQAVRAAIQAFGKLDGLVNNAGIHRFGPLLETSLVAYEEVIAVDQIGVFLGMRACGRAIADAGGGTMVNTSSTAGFRGLPGTIAYVSAKWAVRGMTKVAAIEFAAYGIRVNAIVPGTIDTSMSAPEALRGWAGGSAGGFTNIPLRRKGRPEEIAQLALFLSCEDSSFCTGAEFVADGGDLAGPMNRD